MEPLMVAEAVSDSIVRIMKQSTNRNFVEKCCMNLKVSTPVEAKQELNKRLLAVLGCPSVLGSNDHESHNNEVCFSKYGDNKSITVTNSALIKFNKCNDINGVSLISNSTPDSYPPNLPNFSHVGSPCNGNINLNSQIPNQSCEIFDTVITSTPEENDKQPLYAEGHGENSEVMLLEGVDAGCSEILRCGELLVDKESVCYENYNFESLKQYEEISVESNDSPCNDEYSLDSLKHLNIQDFSYPTASDPSLHFSNPDCLNESYLMDDIMNPMDNTCLNECCLMSDKPDLTKNTENPEKAEKENDETFSQGRFNLQQDSQTIISNALQTLTQNIDSNFNIITDSCNDNEINLYCEVNDLNFPPVDKVNSELCESMSTHNSSGDLKILDYGFDDIVLICTESPLWEPTPCFVGNDKCKEVKAINEADDDDCHIIGEVINKRVDSLNCKKKKDRIKASRNRKHFKRAHFKQKASNSAECDPVSTSVKESAISSEGNDCVIIDVKIASSGLLNAEKSSQEFLHADACSV